MLAINIYLLFLSMLFIIFIQGASIDDKTEEILEELYKNGTLEERSFLKRFGPKIVKIIPELLKDL